MKTIHNKALAERLQPEFAAFMTRADQIRWTPTDVPYDRIDRSKLTIGDLFAVFVTLHIENYSDVYTKLLMDSYPDMPLLQSFVRNWEKEEENHARVLEKYLMTLGIPLDELRANYAKVDKNDFPVPTRNQSGLNVFVYFQELLTREMYTKILKGAKEPVLVDILKKVVRDEERHFRFYKLALTQRMELDKSDTLKQFRNVVRLFGMPQTMFRQKAMTDKLMEFYQYDANEIGAITNPVIKFLEASPSPLFNRFPKLQALWQKRRAAVYLVQSPYLWGHLKISIQNKLGLGAVPRAEQEYVDSVIARLQKLLEPAASNVAPFRARQAAASL